MFKIPLTRKQVEKELSKYQKINYNQFRWWRSYQPKNKPLDNRKPLRDRILNGDFDYSCYKAQQYQVEYQLNDILEECGIDYQKYLVNSTVRERNLSFSSFSKSSIKRFLRALITDVFSKYFW